MKPSIRVPLVEPGTRDELAEIERAILRERGDISVLYQVLLNSAPIAAGWEKLLTAVRKKTSVPAALRELIILRVAVLNQATFEFEAHVPYARAAGVTDAKIDAVRHGSAEPGMGASALEPASAWSDDERLVLELTDAMTRDIEVTAEIIARLKARFDTQRTVELVATVAAYNMVSRFLVALGVVH
jgi:AhpD family alkylhydroperoxidase